MGESKQASRKETRKVKDGRAHTLPQKLQQQIVEYVIDQGIQPGDRLPTEPELCELFGVSRTAVREAMKYLEILGVVSLEPGRGTFLRPFDVGMFLSRLPIQLLFRKEDLLEVIRVRHTLEELCLEQAILSADAEDLRALSECVQAMKVKVDAGETMESEDIAFHRQLARMADARMLLVVLEIFWDLRLRQPMHHGLEALRLRYQRHERIYRAIERRDLGLARLYMAEHFAGSYEELVDNLDRSADHSYITLRSERTRG